MANNSASSVSSPVDVLCVGFGPASLALAVAIAEHNATSLHPRIDYSSLGGLQQATTVSESGKNDNFPSSTEAGESASGFHQKPLSVGFIEKHPHYKWHPGMMLEGSTMQISFLKDLATLRNPQSSYTFLSYLASFTPSRLVSFISRETFTPSRREYADYMEWAARKVEKELESSGKGFLGYGEAVVAVEAVKSGQENEIDLVKIVSRKEDGGEIVIRFARNVILSTGGSPRVPRPFQTESIRKSGRIFHSSQFLDKSQILLDSILNSIAANRPIRIAVFGSGQSAAETFLTIRSALATRLAGGKFSLNHRPEVYLFIRGATLRPADDSPFSNEVFDPAMSQRVYGLDSQGRERVMKDAKATNYSVVNPKTLAQIYETMYSQQVETDIKTRDHLESTLMQDPKLIIRPYTVLESATTTPSAQTLTLATSNSVNSTTQVQEFDGVICGTGYDRQGWKNILFHSADNSLQSGTNDSSVASIPLNQVFPPKNSSVPAFNLLPGALANNPQFKQLSTPSSPTSSAADSLVMEPSRSSSPVTAPSSRGSFSAGKEEAAIPDFGVTEAYRLKLPETTAEGIKFQPKVWLQGSCETSHGISDSLLSVLAVRSGEVIENVLHEGWFGKN